MRENVIEIAHLTKSYQKLKAVDDLSFTVHDGEILGLLGPNGSGKSTTMNCILSLLNFDQGSIRIFGKEMSVDAYDIKRQIGVVFQDVAVFDELSVYDNIDYFCGLYIKDKKERRECIDDAIELVGLQEYRKFLPKQLSGGLLRRLNIACGIAHRPKLVFLDEPTVAVDPQSRNHILDGIKTLRDRGATVIYTTHYMEEVEILCDRVIIIDKGKLLAEGTCDELKGLVQIEEKVSVEIPQLEAAQQKAIAALENACDVSYHNQELTVVYQKGSHNLSDLINYLNQEHIIYNRIYSQRPTLNDVFLELTGKELRD